jgi:hypothetical protein
MAEFRSGTEEIDKLIAEIGETKATLKGMAVRLDAIEKHLRRVFQLPKPSRPARGQRSAQVDTAHNRDALLAMFDDLRHAQASGDMAAVDVILARLPEPDARALAKEIGIAGAKKNGLAKVRQSILQRVRESVLLGAGSLRGPEENKRHELSEPEPS